MSVSSARAARGVSRSAGARGRVRRWWQLPPLSPPLVADRTSPELAVSSAAGRSSAATTLVVIGVLAVILRASDQGWPLAVWLQVGPGLIAVLAAGVTIWHRVIFLGLVASQALLVAVSMPLAWVGSVTHPASALAIALVTVVGWIVVCRRQGRPRWTQGRDWVRHLPALLALGGLGLAIATASVHAGDPQPGGLATSAGPWWLVGVLITLVMGIGSWLRRWPMAVPVLCLCSVVAFSQATMYREPTVNVAARHLGVIDAIAQQGGLLPTLDIYQTWAGLFTATELTLGLAGSAVAPFGWAAAWGAAAVPVMVLGVRAVAGRFVGARAAWLAALLFGLASSLTTSFFAPQVLGFILVLGVLSLVLARPREPRPRAILRWIVVVGLCVVIVVTHQISPFFLGFALGLLCLFRLVKPWWTPLVPLVLAAAFALGNADVLTRYVSPETFGRLLSNLSPPEHPAAPLGVALINRLTFGVPAVALIVVGLIAVLAWRHRPDRVTWGLTAAAASPLLLAVGTNYGQEGIFRIVLFALPWLVILCATVIDQPLDAAVRPRRRQPPSPHRWSTRIRGPLLAAALAALFAIQVLGLTGMDWVRVIRADDVAITQAYERGAPAGSVAFTLGTQVATPTQSTGSYLEVGYLGREDLLKDRPQRYPDPDQPYDPEADLVSLSAVFAETPATRHYLIVAPLTGMYGERYGFQSLTDYQALSAAAARSPLWELVERRGETSLYVLREQS